MSLEDLSVTVTDSQKNTHILSFAEEAELAQYLQVVEDKVGHLIHQDRGEETYRFKLYLCWLCKLNEDMERLIGVPISSLDSLFDGIPYSSSTIPANDTRKEITMVKFFRPFVLEIFIENFFFNEPKTDPSVVKAIELIKICCTQLGSPEEINAFLNEDYDNSSKIALRKARYILENSNFADGPILNKLFIHDIFTNPIVTLKGIITMAAMQTENPDQGWIMEC